MPNLLVALHRHLLNPDHSYANAEQHLQQCQHERHVAFVGLQTNSAATIT